MLHLCIFLNFVVAELSSSTGGSGENSKSSSVRSGNTVSIIQLIFYHVKLNFRHHRLVASAFRTSDEWNEGNSNHTK